MADDDFAAFMRGDAAAPTGRLTRGERRTCRVVHVGADQVFVDLGTRAEGRIPRPQLQRADGSPRVAVGDSLEATVVEPDGPDGPLLSVTLTRDQQLDLPALQLALESGTPVEGRVTRAVKGGFELELAGVRAFCPASQAATSYVADLSSFVGETMRVAILELRDGGKSVVVSRRKVLEAERADAARESAARLTPGAVVDGTVTSLQKFGAFVDVGGVEGLVHISELSPRRVERADEVVQVGERVRVKVLAIEADEGGRGPKVRLSLKATQQVEDPARDAVADEVLKAEVVRLLPHAVVVNTPRGEGLVPVRELGLTGGADHRRAFAVGDTFEVTWLGAPSARPRFSVTRVEEVRARADFDAYKKQTDAGGGGGMGNLGALLSDLDRADLPPGPPPPAPPAKAPRKAPIRQPVATPPRAAAPSPEPASPAPRAQVDPGEAGQDTRGDAPAPDRESAGGDEPVGPRRRRIVSRR